MASIDIKGVFKDNAKLFLSIGGILLITLYIGITGGPGLNLDLPGIESTGNNSVNTNVSNNGGVQAVNNGKANSYTSAPTYTLENGVDYSARINTSLGSITVDLYETQTPYTVNNFVFLANDDFYNGTSFHKVIQNFIIQGGDPQGDGFGGPGYYIQDEIRPDIRFKSYSLAMANGGANTNGSQFFIVASGANTVSLDGMYTVFGEVTDGFNVVDAIEKVSVKQDTPNQYMPLSPVYIYSVDVITAGL